MLKPIKSNILNPIQLAAEVRAALQDNTVVVVNKRQLGANYDQPVYDIYAGQGKIVDGQIVDHQK